MGRVIVLGSINVDLETKIVSYPNPDEKVVGESLQRYAGGKGAYQAGAARGRGPPCPPTPSSCRGRGGGSRSP